MAGKIRRTNLYRSPLIAMRQYVATTVDNLEVILPDVFPPWEADPRVAVDINQDRSAAIEHCLLRAATGVHIFTDGSLKNDRIGYSIVS